MIVGNDFGKKKPNVPAEYGDGPNRWQYGASPPVALETAARWAA
jgi:hypothetical protein